MGCDAVWCVIRARTFQANTLSSATKKRLKLRSTALVFGKFSPSLLLLSWLRNSELFLKPEGSLPGLLDCTLSFMTSASYKIPFQDLAFYEIPVQDLAFYEIPFQDLTSYEIPLKDLAFYAIPFQDLASYEIPFQDLASGP
jgi:hypothetical protein